MVAKLAEAGAASAERGGAPPPARTSRQRWVLPVLVALLLFTLFVAVSVGAVYIPLRTVLALLANWAGAWPWQPSWTPTDESIIVHVRLPRVISAALVGAALSISGVLFQGLLRNPLADPYVLGTSGGAALGATIGLLLMNTSTVLGFGTVPALAFVGALLAMLLVYSLSYTGGRAPVITLLLAGFAVSVILGCIMSLLIILHDRLQLETRVIYAWLLGGISLTRWSHVAVIACLTAAGSTVAFFLGRSLNAFALGEEAAQQLGIPVERHKAAILATGSLLTAAAVSAGGLIGFVGLIVPHFFRLRVGPNHSRLLPLAGVGGAIFLVIADVLARRVMPPTELPVGILTALVGGPAFLLLLHRSKEEYRF